MSKLFTVSFSDKNFKETTSFLSNYLKEENKPFHVVTANPEIVMHANKNKDYASLLNQADLIVPDGIGIIIASKLLNLSLSERIAGIDLIHSLFDHFENEKRELRIYLLGAKPNIIDNACLELSRMYQQLTIVGSHHGYFSEAEEGDIVESINDSKPDLLLVGLGFPKQDCFIHKHKGALNAKLLIGCGGSFDVFSGRVKRAPRLFQKIGLEWFWRLLSEPSRWKRQLTLIHFLVKVLKKKLRGF